jgi:hypothetical protein
MRDPIDRYLENVLCYADLAPRDERSVRAELSEHLHELTASGQSSNPSEVYAMLNDQFGTPKRVGRAIAAAKGRVRTWFKKFVRKAPLRVGIAVVLGIAVRYSVAQSFYVPGDGVAPAVPRGSRVLVYKLAKFFDPCDVVVFRNSQGVFLIGMIQCEDKHGGWYIQKNSDKGKVTYDVSRDDIIGRVILNTR